MARRDRRGGSKGRGRDRPSLRRRPQLLSSDSFVVTLHRRPCRWDVLVFELSRALSAAYAKLRPSLQGILRFGSEDLPAIGLMLAQGFEVILRRVMRDEPAGPVVRAIDAGALRRDEAEALAARVAAEAFDPLLRKYVEDVYDELRPRPDRELSRVVDALAAALRGLLTERCEDRGDLAASFAEPLAPATDLLPANSQPRDPAATTGSRARDVLLLAPTVHPSDDSGEAKRKLVHFVRHDPWLFAESLNFVVDRCDASDADDWQKAPDVEVFSATDDFLYRATRVGGLTPIELFVQRQPDPAAPQCRRLLRWSDEAFSALFQVRQIRFPELVLRDLEDNRDYEVFSTRPEALRAIRPRELLFTRVAPWDDKWVLSGVQQKWGMPDEHTLVSIKNKLKLAPPHRRVNPDDPAVRKAFTLQAEQHGAWVEMFGSDEVEFDDGARMEDALNRFMRHWSQERRDPETGMTPAEKYERQFERPAPDAASRLPEGLRDAAGSGVVFDPVHGIILLGEFREFRRLFETDAPPTARQLALVDDYVRQASVHYVVVRRARDRNPGRMEQVLRLALRDEEFQLERDFEPLLRKYKGGQMREPPRPSLMLVHGD
jgi:hypothetical protein